MHVRVCLNTCLNICLAFRMEKAVCRGGFKLNKIEGQRVREDTEGEERQENYCRRVLSYPQHTLWKAKWQFEQLPRPITSIWTWLFKETDPRALVCMCVCVCIYSEQSFSTWILFSRLSLQLSKCETKRHSYKKDLRCWWTEEEQRKWGWKPFMW